MHTARAFGIEQFMFGSLTSNPAGCCFCYARQRSGTSEGAGTAPRDTSRWVKDDVGLGNVTENDFEYLFQTLVEMDTGGDAFLKQVVDVYLLSVPNEETCPVIPDLTSLSLAKGEVDQVMYLELDRLQEVYTTSPPPHDFVVFPGDDYQTRFFFNLRQRHKKYLEKVAEPPMF